MKPITVAGIVLGVALARLIGIGVSAEISALATDERWLSFYYYPAGAIDVIALLVFGYWAAVGAGLACVLWNLCHFDLSAFDVAIMALASISRGLAALWMFYRLVPHPPEMLWVTPTLTRVFILSVTYTIVAGVSAFVVFSNATPAQNPTGGEIVSLAAGTIVGAYGGFLALNLTFSAYLSRRLKSD